MPSQRRRRFRVAAVAIGVVLALVALIRPTRAAKPHLIRAGHEESIKALFGDVPR